MNPIAALLEEIFAALSGLLASFGGLGASAAASAGGEHRAADLAPLTVAQRVALVHQIISAEDLDGMNANDLFVMFDMEQGLAEGDFTATFQQTNSLSNRHVGNGQHGVPNSDGEWTGSDFVITNARGEVEDLRIYSSLESSVRDFVLLMGDPLYAIAKAKSQEGDSLGFFAAVAAAGYSDQPGYAGILQARAHSLGVA